MEEQNKKAKTVEMKDNNSQKLTYEQLNAYCMEMFQENQRLVQQIRQLQATTAYKRLDYLFKVLEFSSIIKDAEFINDCIDEIKDAIVIPEESSEEG